MRIISVGTLKAFWEVPAHRDAEQPLRTWVRVVRAAWIFTEATLPSPLVGYERWGETVFAALRGERRDVYYDTLRRPVWRGEQ